MASSNHLIDLPIEILTNLDRLSCYAVASFGVEESPDFSTITVKFDKRKKLPDLPEKEDTDSGHQAVSFVGTEVAKNTVDTKSEVSKGSAENLETREDEAREAPVEVPERREGESPEIRGNDSTWEDSGSSACRYPSLPVIDKECDQADTWRPAKRKRYGGSYSYSRQNGPPQNSDNYQEDQYSELDDCYNRQYSPDNCYQGQQYSKRSKCYDEQYSPDNKYHGNQYSECNNYYRGQYSYDYNYQEEQSSHGNSYHQTQYSPGNGYPSELFSPENSFEYNTSPERGPQFSGDHYGPSPPRSPVLPPPITFRHHYTLAIRKVNYHWTKFPDNDGGMFYIRQKLPESAITLSYQRWEGGPREFIGQVSIPWVYENQSWLPGKLRRQLVCRILARIIPMDHEDCVDTVMPWKQRDMIHQLAF